MSYAFSINGGAPQAPRDAARALRADYGTAARTAYPSGARAPDMSTSAILRAALAEYPHTVDAWAARPCAVRAVWVDAR